MKLSELDWTKGSAAIEDEIDRCVTGRKPDESRNAAGRRVRYRYSRDHGDALRVLEDYYLLAGGVTEITLTREREWYGLLGRMERVATGVEVPPWTFWQCIIRGIDAADGSEWESIGEHEDPRLAICQAMLGFREDEEDDGAPT